MRTGILQILPPIFCRGLRATIVGGERDNTLIGTADADVIVGLGGNDIIYGLGGNDVICGGAGNDVLLGGGGSDRLFGDAGSDILDVGVVLIEHINGDGLLELVVHVVARPIFGGLHHEYGLEEQVA